jgi:putative ATP-dependent endonuclease of OLD family
LTMLQHLAAAKGMASLPDDANNLEGNSTDVERPHLPSLILAIEEPELYQHPSRQRHLASVLLKLAHGTIPGVAKRTQVLYSTHSPLFVGLDRFDQIRLLRKADHTAGKPRVTKVAKAELSSVAEKLWDACGREGDIYTAETLRPRLQAVMTPWVNEGFFADVVVLVEGEDDRAAILGMAQSLGHDLDSLGISVVPCMGKNSLDRPLVIFRQLGIPVYVVWDSDYGENGAPKANRYLLRLVGQVEDDWPGEVGVCYACFKTKLESVLSEEIGEELFDKKLSEVRAQLGIPNKKDALKNPTVLLKVVEKAAIEGKISPTLKNIVEKIVAQKPQLGRSQ